MDTEITVEEFVAGEIKRLNTFREMWIQGNEKNPTDYPTYLLRGDWDEQFNAYSGLEE